MKTKHFSGLLLPFLFAIQTIYIFRHLVIDQRWKDNYSFTVKWKQNKIRSDILSSNKRLLCNLDQDSCIAIVLRQIRNTSDVVEVRIL